MIVTNHIFATRQSAGATRMSHFLKALTGVVDTQGPQGSKERARLLTIVLLTLIGVFALVDTARLLTMSTYQPPWYGYVYLGTAYAFNRARCYAIAAMLMIAMFPLVIFTSIASNASQNLDAMLQYLVLSVFLASIFVSWRGVAILGIVNSCGMLLLPILVPDAVPAFTSIVTPLAVNTIGTILALVSLHHRDQLERLRQAKSKQLEQQLNHAHKMEALGQFAGSIAHDFNNLLTVILGYVDLTLITSTDMNVRQDAEQIRQTANRGRALIRQLLAFSRQQAISPRILDLNTLVTNMDQLLQRLIGTDIRLVTQLAPELGLMQADPGQLEQVIMNLAVNARDAMPGGGTLTIATAHAVLDKEHRRHIKLTVSDTGVGMDAATCTRIFDPFFTTKSVEKGTGLGLAIVQGIVAQSGGHIVVNSKPGSGTCFTMYLPCVEGSVTLPGADEVPSGEAICTMFEHTPLSVRPRELSRSVADILR